MGEPVSANCRPSIGDHEPLCLAGTARSTGTRRLPRACQTRRTTPTAHGLACHDAQTISTTFRLLVSPSGTDALVLSARLDSAPGPRTRQCVLSKMAASIAAPLDLLAGWLALVSPAQACQALLALLGAGIVAATLLPAGTQKHLLDYGARDASGAAAASTGSNTAAGHSSAAGAQPASSPPHPEASALEKAVASVVARTQVPHNWFVSFYVFHLLCTAFWVEEWWRWSRDAAVSVSASASTSASPNNLFGLLVMSQQNADLRATPSPAPSMALVHVLVGMGLMALHTGRRLYEYIYVFQPSKSKMNISHLALGLVFYAILSVAVWIEGSRMQMLSSDL